MSKTNLAEDFFKKLEEKIDEKNFKLWIKPLSVEIKKEDFFVITKNKFAKNWIEKEYRFYFNEVLSEIDPEKIFSLKIEFKLNKSSFKKNSSTKLRKISLPKTAQKNKYIENPNLVKEYTFDKFVRGDSNSMALDAAKKVAEKPGKIYNPLYIYGETALGKTHLMTAIGHKILEKNPDANVYFISSEKFAQEMSSSINENKMEEFKKKYRNLDVLLIDDIQFFLGKNKSMEEFFHTFNTLSSRENQIVLTSDVHPSGTTMESRIKSRLNEGLSVAVNPPKFETRKEILLKKAADKGVVLPDEVAHYLAKKIESHVRDLEGAINKVIASSSFRCEEISIALVNRELKDMFDIKKNQITIDNIQKTVADYFKITLIDLLGKGRTKSIIKPRQMAMALARELTSNSLPEIGKSFGGKDHSTVINALKRVKSYKTEDRMFKEDWENICRKLRN